MDTATDAPICTFPQVADLVGMKEQTLRSWARPTPRRGPLVHTVANRRRGWPTIPLAGLVEARSLRALRDLVSMQKIVPAVEGLRERTGDEYVLAKPKLFVSTAGELFEKDAEVFVRLRDNQIQVPQVLDDYMRSVEIFPDGTPRRYRILLHGRSVGATLFIDPRLNAGRPSFANGTPAFAVLGAFDGGDSITAISDDYDLDATQIEAAIEARDEYAA